MTPQTTSASHRLAHSHPHAHAHVGRLNRALTRVSEAPLRAGNQLTLLRNGPDTYDDWLAAIRGAQRWVHLENYIFKDDGIGQRFADALLERASVGVRVRVLYDWFGSLDVSNRFWRRLREGGVDVRVVNPPTVGEPLDIVQRDHRKLVAVDGSYASIGGVCIADPWLEQSPVTGLPYRDTAVRVCGPAVADLEHAFASVWDSNGDPLPPDELPSVDDMPRAGDIAARVIAQEPQRMRMMRVLQVLLAGVQERIWIADAYFLAAPILREALIAAAHDGIDVRILLPSTNDLPLVGVLSRSGYRPLLEAGVRIWEYAGLMMHAKTTVADGWWSRIGSTNLNMTGLLTNWEIDLVAEDPEFGAAMERMYEEDLADAREIRLGGPARRQQPRPVRPESSAERQARHKRPNLDTQAAATVARARAGLRVAGSATLQRNERLVGSAVGASLLGLGLVAAKFPRVLSWPVAALSGAFGSLALIRSLRQSREK
ncbi:MAG TPA: phospholipase D-like domain-containing protein [Roseiflexaceae bacterium]|nr:phospholipase D-like domain-containing protein [Roseiflexaceae bacterium]